MKTAGSFLKEAREKKGISLVKIAQETKIKEKFLSALESDNWTTLPNLSIARGFVRSYATTVGVDPEFAQALLRRDFPPSSASPKKNIEESLEGRSVWTPKATLLTIILLGILAVSVYLARQYIGFWSAPPLEAKISVDGENVVVSGKTSPSATVEVNRESVLVDDKGNFTISIAKDEVGKVVEIKSVSRAGKETVVKKPVD